MTQPTASRSVLRTGLAFAESPRWHDGALWVSDMAAGTVLRVDLDGRSEVICEIPGQPSGLGWLPDGDLLVVSMHERLVLRFDGEHLSQYADPRGLLRADLNDMVVDGRGNAYVSGFGYDGATEPHQPTGIVLVRPDGTSEMQPGDLYRPNGCVVTPDQSTLIVAETRVHRLTAFAIAADGRLSDPRSFGALPSGSWSDGICLDAEGAVWVADPKARRCVRMLPGGELTDVIDTAPYAAVACMLGGPDGDLLFIVLGEIQAMDLAREKRGGRIEYLQVVVPGAGWP
jgi:sugar lactone lactonase YvrE